MRSPLAASMTPVHASSAFTQHPRLLFNTNDTLSVAPMQKILFPVDYRLIIIKPERQANI
jgi:hypothetical protein